MKVKKFLKYWLPLILYASAIFILSSISSPPRLMPYFLHSDKVSHFIEYAVLSFLIIRALASSERINLKPFDLRALVILLACFYGVTDEIHQYFVPERHMDILDLLSNSLGAFIGQLFFKMKG